MSPDQILDTSMMLYLMNARRQPQPQPPPQINVMSIKATELDQNNPKCNLRDLPELESTITRCGGGEQDGVVTGPGTGCRMLHFMDINN